MKHESVRLALWRGSSGHVSVNIHAAIERANLAALKVGTRPTKEKVDVAGDKAATIVLPTHAARRKLLGTDKPARLYLARRQRTRKQRVLVSQDATGIDNQAVTIGVQGNRLANLAPVARVVFDREVYKRHVVGIDQHRIRTEGAELSTLTATVFRGHLGAQAAHNTHAIGRFALNRHVRTANLDSLAILAWRYQHTHRHGLIGHALLHRLECCRNATIRAFTHERHLKDLLFINHLSLRFLSQNMRPAIPAYR